MGAPTKGHHAVRPRLTVAAAAAAVALAAHCADPEPPLGLRAGTANGAAGRGGSAASSGGAGRGGSAQGGKGGKPSSAAGSPAFGGSPPFGGSSAFGAGPVGSAGAMGLGAFAGNSAPPLGPPVGAGGYPCATRALYCACDADGACGDKLTCVDGKCRTSGALKPVAATAELFQWHSLQADLRTTDGTTCKSRITLSVSNQAVCYVGADDELKCAGKLATTSFGAAFAGTGQRNVDQIFLSRALDDYANACLLAEGRVRCMGTMNTKGELGLGHTSPVAWFTEWEGFDDVARIAGDLTPKRGICALRTNGEAHCAGYSYGPTPTLVASGVSSMHVASKFVANDPNVYRAGSVPIKSTGIASAGLPFPIQVSMRPFVDALALTGLPVLAFYNALVWLEDDGTAHAIEGDGPAGLKPPATVFAPGRVLAIAGAPQGATLCAVYDDASLWCLGNNEYGKLGDTTYKLPFELHPLAMVVGPGGVRVGCD